jgi:hypothetical protein
MPGRWDAFGSVLGLIVVGNLALGAALVAARPPARAVSATGAGLLPPFPQEVEALRRRIAEGRHGEPYTLTLSDEDLTAVAARYLATSSVPVTRVRISVRRGSVAADGVTRGFAVAVPVHVDVMAGARQGRPWVQVASISLGSAPLPAFVRDQVAREVSQALDFEQRPLPVTVDALELRSGAMFLRGTVR